MHGPNYAKFVEGIGQSLVLPAHLVDFLTSDMLFHFKTGVPESGPESKTEAKFRTFFSPSKVREGLVKCLSHCYVLSLRSNRR